MSLLDETLFDPLPAWGAVFVDDVRSWDGWVEQIEIAGAAYVSITPQPGRAHRILINATHIARIDVREHA